MAMSGSRDVPLSRWIATGKPPPLLLDAEPVAEDTAARLLNVSVSSLRSWTHAFGFPRPEVLERGPATYPAVQVLLLRRALADTSSVVAAIDRARRQLDQGQPESGAAAPQQERRLG